MLENCEKLNLIGSGIDTDGIKMKFSNFEISKLKAVLEAECYHPLTMMVSHSME